MLILGSLIWTTTGAGSPPPPPPVVDETPPPRGTVPFLWPLEGRGHRPEELRRTREQFGIADEAAAAIAEVAARQAAAEAAAQAAADEQKRFDELYRELELRRLDFDARYMEVLAAMRAEFIAEFKRRQKDEEEILLLLTMIAAASL